MTSTCLLCLKNKELRDSHIIPKFVYKPVEDSIRKSIPISEQDVFKAVQSGIKEPMLCGDCELKFSQYEGELARFLKDVQGQNPATVTNQGQVLYTQGFDYAKIKKAIISIVWRLSHTKRIEFKRTQLGTYQERFRILLDNDETIPMECFPIMVDKLANQGQFIDGMIMNFDMGKNEKFDFKFQSVCLYGTIFEILMKEDITKHLPANHLMVLHGTTYSPIMIKEISSIFDKNKKLLKRFFDPDVETAMRKLRP